MAFIEMSCNCMASFQADVQEVANESLVIMWAQQFVSAHQQCGYMNPVKTDTPEKHRKFEFETDVMHKEKKEKEL